MKQLLAVIALILVILTGCSSNTDSKKEAMDGESIYAQKCAACHGGNLKGAVGPSILNMGSKYSEKELLKIITDGTDKMPGHILTDEKSSIITKWLMEK
jgi:mono/diheme cytochrome c family protein